MNQISIEPSGAIYTITSDGFKFDSQYPIHLQQYNITPQEYQQTVGKLNSLLQTVQSQNTKGLILSLGIFMTSILLVIVTLPLIIGVIIAGIIVGALTRMWVIMIVALAIGAPCLLLMPFAFIGGLIPMLVNVFKMFFRAQETEAKVKKILEEDNQKLYYPKGVQFMLKSNVIYHRKHTQTIWKIEIYANPNQVQQMQQMQQKPQYSQQVVKAPSITQQVTQQSYFPPVE
jgi:hypothetical protein